MLFDSSNSLRRQLLTPVGQGGFTAPLRAYGKIPVSSEYVDVACDAVDAASRFRQWIQSGVNVLYASRQSASLSLQDHRLILSTPNAAALVIACLWHSSDKRSEQGIQRSYPFSLFVVIPAPPRPWKLATLLGLSVPLWRQIAGLYPTLLAAGDRAECFARIRNESIAVTQHPEPVVSELLAAADIDLRAWFGEIGGDRQSGEAALAPLQRTHADHWQSRGRRPEMWRFPLSVRDDGAVQAAVWLTWLDRNLKRPPAGLGVLVPDNLSKGGDRLCVLCRPCTTQDFLLLAAEPTASNQPASDAEASFLSPTPHWDLSSLRSLRDLAAYEAPVPPRRWFSR